MKIDFTDMERQVVEESFQQYMQVLIVVARLKGLNPQRLGALQLSDDRSGFVLPDPATPPKE